MSSNDFKTGDDKYITYLEIFNNRILNENNGSLCKVNKNQNKIIFNDLLVTASSETPEEVGITSVYKGKNSPYLNSFCFGLRPIIENVNSEYINLLLSSKQYRLKITQIAQGSTRFNMSKKTFLSLNILLPNLHEQNKIIKFFSLLDKQISLWERKLELYELFYKHIKQLSLKNIEKFNDKKSFNEVFEETREINKNNFSQYTVGKHNILKIEKTNYDLSNHKMFTINNLLLGIGIEEVQFNLHINNGCCSPIYKVYNLINKELNHYFYLFLKDIFIKNKAFISRKSTRRNYEFLYKDLLSFNLPIPDLNFKKNIATLMKIENILELLTQSLNIYKNKKCFFLNKLFI